MANRELEYDDLRIYKKEAIKAAKQLQYSQECIKKIEAAETESQVINIMRSERNKE